MRVRRLLSMRWWLAVVLSCLAATTALIVAQVFASSAESGIRARSAELTAGAALTAAADLAALDAVTEIEDAIRDIALRRRLVVFLFDADGRRLSPYRVLGVSFPSLPNGPELRAAALDGRRVVETIDDGRRVTVALPIRGGPATGLVAVASRPDLETALGIVRNRIIRAAAWATLAGAVIGVVIALLITRRLRRISAAAEEFEVGRPDLPLGVGFPDELGSLAATIDAMRGRLRSSFATLEVERDRLLRLLEQLQEGVVAVDRSLRIEFANTRARTYLGGDLDPGSPLLDPWEHPSLRDLARALFRPGAGAVDRVVEVDPWHVFQVTGIPAAGDASSAVIVVTDVTVRERTERAEREFVANAAHELRTPLAAIGSAVEVLNGGAKDDPAQLDRFLGIVARQSARLNALVQALLTLARAQTDVEAVRPTDVDLRGLLDDLVEELELPGDALDVEPGLVLRTHPDLLRQAVANLLANAMRHGRGDEVSVRGFRRDGAAAVVEVSDRGPGMTAEESRKAFDRFYRGTSPRSGGHGLGLSIVREVAQALGGSVEVTTAPGEGTSVRLVLPATETVPA